MVGIREDMERWLKGGCNGREGMEDYYDLYIEHWESRSKVVGSWKKRLEEVRKYFYTERKPPMNPDPLVLRRGCT